MEGEREGGREGRRDEGGREEGREGVTRERERVKEGGRDGEREGVKVGGRKRGRGKRVKEGGRERARVHNITLFTPVILGNFHLVSCTQTRHKMKAPNVPTTAGQNGEAFRCPFPRVLLSVLIVPPS